MRSELTKINSQLQESSRDRAPEHRASFPDINELHAVTHQTPVRFSIDIPDYSTLAQPIRDSIADIASGKLSLEDVKQLAKSYKTQIVQRGEKKGISDKDKNALTKLSEIVDALPQLHVYQTASQTWAETYVEATQEAGKLRSLSPQRWDLVQKALSDVRQAALKTGPFQEAIQGIGDVGSAMSGAGSMGLKF